MRIIHANILPMRGDAIEDGFIEFDERIVALGRFDGKPAPGDIDARGATLLPGFIDAHTHLGMCEDSLGFEGDDVNEMTNPCTPNLRALDAVNVFDRCFTEALEAGVTTVATGPGSANPIAGQIAVISTNGSKIDDMVLRAPCAMKFALGENPKTVYNEKKQTPTTRMATAAIIRENLEKAREYADGRKRRKDVPFDAKLEALSLVLKGKIGAHIHAHRTDDIFTAVRIAQEYGLCYSIVHCTQGHIIAEELGRIGVSAMSGPLLCDRSKPELKDSTPATPGVLQKAGVLTAI
ncbi:MAG TPA: amidohydrolase family protein, partial [Clostridiales bacterium]|nr:amidohydrolase family protein [Clostridiales bacterium]